MRNSIYTTYNGKEYRVVRRDGYARLISNDVIDLENGFTEREPEENLNPRIFFKMVSPEEVGDVYSIKPFCLYQGYEFFILREENGHYILSESHTVTGGPLIEKFDFKRVGKYEYEKAVKKEDVDLVYEKKELIPNYFK
ncbi:hypothetical protein BWD09_10985 [Neisseria dentiae]|uniref:Uncharacterized protein n=2 Tax=Neisseria dentiae TaxID=194197 RepID=A0A1X3D427_9NEIS|nr:hypothetical protein BWD09_10985 [Neisseria dentiae]QMT46526.1 hypothetical protein H3L92_09835 [Neisseria dentiae]STZ50452.1 Uncharacterised protein [Neisseria dentiae]